MNELSFPEARVMTVTLSGEPGPSAESDALVELAYLWHLDDPDWVAQREIDWQCLLSYVYQDTSKKEKKEYERYFKKGEKSSYFSPETLVFLTPYNTEEQLLQLFNSQLLDSEGRSFVLSAYMYTQYEYECAHWYESHMMLAINGLLGSEYRIIKESISENSMKVISSDATSWCGTFVNTIIDAILTNKECMPLYQCLNYFITALPFAIDDFREFIQLPKLLKIVDEKLASDELGGRALIFAQAVKDREQDILAAWDIGEQKIAAGMTE